ncbi:hypothetical protein F511_06280 [Dorcoceras hygrometricum]|uniref:Glutaredoxin domain-containing protein n=1 Tax=Dorcoceras hygrometricum TaxID=472368 RepID=A0A2Z7BAA2_9LAMI|nr:hypothetical protein F511_06280 [Dorcoceras hygrometricum]
MVRLLANIIRRGVAPFPAAGSTASGSFYQSVLRFSTNVPDDTHEDFKPTIKTESSGIVIKDIVEQDLKENPVMIYMKGVPDLPRCGFSALALKWGFADVPLSARNILEDLELKNAVKSFSHWPTFPQIFINGEFVGGSDIILNMHQVRPFSSLIFKSRIVTTLVHIFTTKTSDPLLCECDILWSLVL